MIQVILHYRKHLFIPSQSSAIAQDISKLVQRICTNDKKEVSLDYKEVHEYAINCPDLLVEIKGYFNYESPDTPRLRAEQMLRELILIIRKNRIEMDETLRHVYAVHIQLPLTGFVSTKKLQA